MSPSSENLPEDYARGWSDLMRLVRRGYSWSGGERNRFFRNRGDGQFHEMSHLGGLDGVGDGRGLGVVDWDQDGRLDLWYRNRTAPRLQLMMNRRECGESVAIRLQGTSGEPRRDRGGGRTVAGCGGRALWCDRCVPGTVPIAIEQVAPLWWERRCHAGGGAMAGWDA